jgi:hypothetical protein
VYQLASGAVTIACKLRVAKHDLEEVTKAASACQKRQKINQRVVPKGGLLYASQARAAVLSRVERDATKGKGWHPKGVPKAVATPSQPSQFEIHMWDPKINVTTVQKD